MVAQIQLYYLVSIGIFGIGYGIRNRDVAAVDMMQDLRRSYPKENDANRVWLMKGLTPRSGFSDVLSRDYGGVAEELDFKDAPEEAKQRINNWGIVLSITVSIRGRTRAPNTW